MSRKHKLSFSKPKSQIKTKLKIYILIRQPLRLELGFFPLVLSGWQVGKHQERKDRISKNEP